MKILKITLWILVSLLTLWSCEKKQGEITPMNYDNSFYPIEVGNSISYQVESITIDEESGVNDTLGYQIKEIIESVTKQTEEYTEYRLERWFRENTSDSWNVKNVWQIRKYDRKIHKIEENIEYVKILTPIKEGLEWDGNAYNLSNPLIYKAESIKDSLIYKQTKPVLTINQSSKESLIDKISEVEKYAENTGLIYKEQINVILNINPNKPWYQKVTKGTIFRQTMIED